MPLDLRQAALPSWTVIERDDGRRTMAGGRWLADDGHAFTPPFTMVLHPFPSPCAHVFAVLP